jgi:hypothetical protein
MYILAEALDTANIIIAKQNTLIKMLEKGYNEEVRLHEETMQKQEELRKSQMEIIEILKAKLNYYQQISNN